MKEPALGRGDKGSQYWLRRWVNERASELNVRLQVWPSLAAFSSGPLSWMSPLRPDFEEVGDDLWERLRLPGKPPHEEGWWPKRGPVWDAVARVPGKAGERGLLLVEAKSHRDELLSSGAATDPESQRTIDAALAEAKRHLGVSEATSWLRPHYQMANRLAFLYYLRHRREIPTWLLFIYFVGDEFPSGGRQVVGPRSQAEWRPLIRQAEGALGLPETHALAPFVHLMFLPASMP